MKKQPIASSSHLDVTNKSQLMAADEQRDLSICGCSLAEPGTTRFADAGAHDPTPTPYFILEALFAEFGLSSDSHLLDVGCGTGRVLAYFAGSGQPGRATGVELDPDIAARTAAWTDSFPQLDVIHAGVLDIPLAPYTHFYLFNPFDTNVLTAFLAKIEDEAAGPIILIHASDDGETYFYAGRDGWSLMRQGEFQTYRTARGRTFAFYDCPQHFSVWKYIPPA